MCNCNNCCFYLKIWNKLCNLIVYYENVLVLCNLTEAQKAAYSNILSMLNVKKTRCEAALKDLNCPGFRAAPTVDGGEVEETRKKVVK